MPGLLKLEAQFMGSEVLPVRGWDGGIIGATLHLPKVMGQLLGHYSKDATMKSFTFAFFLDSCEIFCASNRLPPALHATRRGPLLPCCLLAVHLLEV